MDFRRRRRRVLHLHFVSSELLVLPPAVVASFWIFRRRLPWSRNGGILSGKSCVCERARFCWRVEVRFSEGFIYFLIVNESGKQTAVTFQKLSEIEEKSHKLYIFLSFPTNRRRTLRKIPLEYRKWKLNFETFTFSTNPAPPEYGTEPNRTEPPGIVLAWNWCLKFA